MATQCKQFSQKLKLNEQQKLFKKIDGEYFIDNVATKYELRNLNVINS